MVSEKKKINRVITFLKKGLSGLADELEGTVEGINEFIKSLSKAQKDLKEIPIESEVQTVSTSSKQVAATHGEAKTAAASTLFTLLSGSPEGEQAIPTPTAAVAAPSGASEPSGGGPPKAPSGSGPPKAPAKAGPPSRGGNLPPAPKLPPGAGGGTVPPKAPTSSGAYAKRAPPPGESGTPPKAPGMPSAPRATVAQAGGGLGSLRDEMLEELTRLKKIMRGE
ncbi:MAG: hypothetical protein ACFFDO_06965 [Candidatus Thorarchaeota archaeon]